MEGNDEFTEHKGGINANIYAKRHENIQESYPSAAYSYTADLSSILCACDLCDCRKRCVPGDCLYFVFLVLLCTYHCNYRNYGRCAFGTGISIIVKKEAYSL